MRGALNGCEVWVVTGFLGSGKTTLLNQWIREVAVDDTLVIVNEFAQTGIDQQTLRSTTEPLLLSGGCLCCSVLDELVDSLLQVAEQRRHGRWPRLRRLALETSGLADPNPVVHALCTRPDLRSQFTLAGVVTVIDATHAIDQLSTFNEARIQVSAADALLISKAVRPESGARELIDGALADINPTAKRYNFTLDGVFDVDNGNRVRPFGVHRATQQNIRANAAARHGSRMSAHVLTLPTSVDWHRFADWLQALCLACGRDLVRVKGLVARSDRRSTMLVNAVHFSVHCEEIAWSHCDPPLSELVLIGRDLRAEAIERTARAALGA